MLPEGRSCKSIRQVAYGRLMTRYRWGDLEDSAEPKVSQLLARSCTKWGIFPRSRPQGIATIPA